MPKAAMYARYSCDLQNDKSIEDQFRLCREYARRNGIEVVAEYCDAAKSGASIFERNGLLSLMAAAPAGKFDIVLSESLDRISRDQEDLAGTYKRLTFLGIKIIGVSGGVADEIQIGVRGLLGSLFLKDLADKVRRGQAGKIAKGMSAGGQPYGYRPVKGEPGRLEIVEEEAEIVRRIFCEYADGASGRKISLRLNADGIPAPRGAAWATSTIMGAAWNMSGILRVPQYHGEIFWNKTRYIKDPSTGKRVSRLNPKEEWQHVEVPELRIVDEDLWEAVQKRLEGTSRGGKGYQRKHRLLSGLLKCGVCGGGMATTGRSANRDRVVCHRAREKGVCNHKRSYFLDKIEEVVLTQLREALSAPEAMERAIDNFVAAQRQKIAGMAKARAKAEGEVARAKARIDRLMDRHIDGELSLEDYRKRVAPLKADHEAAKAALENVVKPPAADLRAEAVTKHGFLTSNMRDMLNDRAERSAEFRDVLRAMLQEVVVFETAPYAPVHVEVRGKMYDLSPDEHVAKEAVALA